MDESEKEQIARLCTEILAPLVRADGGEFFLLRMEGDEVHIHLAGACAGCPGASITGETVILAALRSVRKEVRLVLTTGVKSPAANVTR